MSNQRTAGDKLRLLADGREITTTRKWLARVVTITIALLGVVNGSVNAPAGDIFALAGGVTGVAVVATAIYWLLLRGLSQTHTARLCPKCGDAEVEQPVIGVESEPDGPYCPAADCDWVGSSQSTQTPN